MAKWAKCDDCGSEVWFDAYATLDGEVINMFETAFCSKCSETGDGEIKYAYSIVNGTPPVEA